MNKIISQIYESSFALSLDGLACLDVQGVDCLSFLAGQLTTNILNMEKNQFSSFCRLDPKGRIKFSGYICAKEKGYILITEKKEAPKLMADLDMFIISEDVELKMLSQLIVFSTDLNFLNRYSNSHTFIGNYNFLPGFLTLLEADDGLKLEVDSSGLIKKVFSLLDCNIQGQLFNEVLVSLYSDHKEKGCFVGQEVVNKISNNRGSRKFPVLFSTRTIKDSELELSKVDKLDVFYKESNIGNIVGFTRINDYKYFNISVLREHRKNDNTLELRIGEERLNGSIDLFDDLFQNIYKKISDQYFFQAVDALNKDDVVNAEMLLKISIASNHQNAESLEALGVLYGRKKDYQKAHKMMDKLLQIDPTSVMAHTNKSLFYMNEGKIEEAEIEKDLALKKGVSENLASSEKEAVEKERVEKIKKQIEMYLEVLEIDPEDEFALSKSLELLLEIKEFSKMDEILKGQKKPLAPYIYALKLNMYKAMNSDYSVFMGEIDQKLKEALKLGDTKAAKILETFKK